jgi:hypothetical protein
VEVTSIGSPAGWSAENSWTMMVAVAVDIYVPLASVSWNFTGMVLPCLKGLSRLTGVRKPLKVQTIFLLTAVL